MHNRYMQEIAMEELDRLEDLGEMIERFSPPATSRSPRRRRCPDCGHYDGMRETQIGIRWAQYLIDTCDHDLVNVYFTKNNGDGLMYMPCLRCNRKRIIPSDYTAMTRTTPAGR